MKAFLTLLVVTSSVFAQALPPNAVTYLPILSEEVSRFWPDVTPKATFAAQVEQETCVSLKSKRCWSPTTELKTDREYGFGLGQITVTKRFDNFKAARELDASLRDWQWGDRYDARRQLRTLVLMDKAPYKSLSSVADHRERLAMAFSSYNGGLGGVLQDRRLCGTIDGCDPNKWFGNVEKYSTKKKTVTSGYGKSFFDINREYVVNVMEVRRPKYDSWFTPPKPQEPYLSGQNDRLLEGIRK